MNEENLENLQNNVNNDNVKNNNDIQTENTTQEKLENNVVQEKTFSFPTVSDLVDSGAQFGHKDYLTHPSMKEFIFSVVNDIAILNLDFTINQLKEACELLKNLVIKNKKILWVGTRQILKDYIKECAEKTDSYYVNHRWSPGLLTNAQVIPNTVKKKNLLNNKINANFTKKEKDQFNRELKYIDTVYGGIMNMNQAPDVIVIFNAADLNIAIKEANLLKIPVIAITDSNADIDGYQDLEGITYPIVSNDDSRKSAQLIGDSLVQAVFEGIQQRILHKTKETKQMKFVKEINKSFKNIRNNVSHGFANIKKEQLINSTTNK